MQCPHCLKEIHDESKECLNCRDNRIVKDNNFVKRKISNIQVIIAAALIAIALILIYKEYKEYRQEQQAVKLINAMDISEKNTQEIIKNSTKLLQDTNKEWNRANEKIKRDMDRENIEMEEQTKRIRTH